MGFDSRSGTYIYEHDPRGHPQKHPAPVSTPARTARKANFCKHLRRNGLV
jgi:hypothetical protein